MARVTDLRARHNMEARFAGRESDSATSAATRARILAPLASTTPLSAEECLTPVARDSDSGVPLGRVVTARQCAGACRLRRRPCRAKSHGADARWTAYGHGRLSSGAQWRGGERALPRASAPDAVRQDEETCGFRHRSRPFSPSARGLMSSSSRRRPSSTTWKFAVPFMSRCSVQRTARTPTLPPS